MVSYLGWLKKEIEVDFGKRCADYNKDCIVCRAWEIFDSICEINNIPLVADSNITVEGDTNVRNMRKLSR